VSRALPLISAPGLRPRSRSASWGELIVATYLAATEETSRIDIEAPRVELSDEESSCCAAGAGYVRICRIAELLTPPAAAHMGADVAAGPGKHGNGRSHGGGFNRHSRREVGGVGLRTGRERDASQQKLLHFDAIQRIG
jgi:hypothetical protein